MEGAEEQQGMMMMSSEDPLLNRMVFGDAVDSVGDAGNGTGDDDGGGGNRTTLTAECMVMPVDSKVS